MPSGAGAPLGMLSSSIRLINLALPPLPATLTAMQILLDAQHIQQTIRQLAQRVHADASLHNGHALALVGIRSRGEILAQRLADEIARLDGHSKLEVGALDITMYRDDLSTRAAITIPQGTEMNFRLDDRPVILVDDVLDTGRSVRAAFDALVDFGRPRVIRLLVLVDRERREYPIAADYVGIKVDAPDPEQKVLVRLRPTDDEDVVYLQT